MARGTLRIYLGAAPGVGKTYAMLDEAHRRKARGTDVVVGLVETHGRARTRAMIGDLEVVPRRTLAYRGTTSRRWTSTPSSPAGPRWSASTSSRTPTSRARRNEKRWQDVEELLDAGITVLTTVNVQHLESVNDVVEKITGIRQQETVPDAIVRGADQVELVDITPEALRRRMAHGNVYAADKIDAALGNYFRVGNLTALRELALLWLADKVDDALQQYRRDHDIAETWETRERVVVALTGGPEGETLIRRAGRIAARGGADLLGVHVSPVGRAGRRRVPSIWRGSATWSSRSAAATTRSSATTSRHALIDFARAENATQLVLGASRRSALAAFFTGPGIGASTVRLSGDIDVHMVTHEQVGRGRRLPDITGGLTARSGCSERCSRLVLLPVTHGRAGQSARPAQPDERPAGLPARRAGGHTRRRRLTRAGRGGCRRACCSTTTSRPPIHRLTISAAGQRHRPRRVRPDGGGGQLGRRPRRAPYHSGRPGQSRVAHSRDRGGQRAARRGGAAGTAGTAQGGSVPRHRSPCSKASTTADGTLEGRRLGRRTAEPRLPPTATPAPPAAIGSRWWSAAGCPDRRISGC